MRHRTIDLLRGISIIAMIFLHINAYYLKLPIAFIFWDVLEFSVPVFVFCSGYLFYKKEVHTKLHHSFTYYRKRLLRLYIPYIVFLLCYVPLVFAVDPSKKTLTYVFQNLALTGGLDLNWMVLLFLSLSLLMPILMYLFNKHKKIFYCYSAVAVVSSVLFLFTPVPYYRLVMWLPWSLLILASWLIAENEREKRWLVVITVASFMIFFLSRFILQSTGRPLTQYANKYPPNLYHLSFGVMTTTALFFAAQYLSRFNNVLLRFIYYFSAHSYSIFFIHFWAIYFARDYLKHYDLPWSLMTFQVFFLTLSIQALLNFCSETLRKPTAPEMIERLE